MNYLFVCWGMFGKVGWIEIWIETNFRKNLEIAKNYWELKF
jgi:hypothetical protein